MLKKRLMKEIYWKEMSLEGERNKVIEKNNLKEWQIRE